MQEYVSFITQHWILASLLGVVLLVFIMNELLHQYRGVRAISPEEAVQLMNRQEAAVFDIRGEALFLTGHILGAESLPASQLEKKMGVLQKYSHRPIIVVAAMGQETGKVVEHLKAKGFIKVVLLKGGMEGWKASGLPLEKR